MLDWLGGRGERVRGHVAAEPNVGNDRARHIDVLTRLLPFIGYPRTFNALRAIDEVTVSRAGQGRGARQKGKIMTNDHRASPRQSSELDASRFPMACP
jgi:hypothetical protein